jgi:glycosyltransferase involved in cell wall biosynthesis
MHALPKVLFIGGPDVDARLELMHRLKNDFEVSALGSEALLSERFLAEGFAYRAYRLSRQYNLCSDLYGVSQISAICRRLKPHIVHTFATKPNVWGRLAARLTGVPITIGTVCGLGSLYVDNDPKTRVLRTLYQPLQKMACNLSDLTIFQNHDDARQFVADGVVAADKMIVIPGSGVATEKFARSQVHEDAQARVKEELSIQAGEIVVTMVSRVTRTKGVLEFAAAAQMVRDCRPDVHFVLIGPFDNSIDHLSTSELTYLKQTVTWPGPRKDIAAVMAASDIFVLPSYREGIPRVLLEAAAMELPIVTTDTPGCNDLVENGVNGFLVPVRESAALSQAILDLVKQPGLRLQFGQAARHRIVERYDLTVIAEQTRAVYRRLLAHKAVQMANALPQARMS